MTTPSQAAINITQEILKKNLFYDEISGIFTWKVKKCGHFKMTKEGRYTEGNIRLILCKKRDFCYEK